MIHIVLKKMTAFSAHTYIAKSFFRHPGLRAGIQDEIIRIFPIIFILDSGSSPE